MTTPDAGTVYFLIAMFVIIGVGLFVCLRFCDEDDGDRARAHQPAAESSAEQRADQPAPPPPESEEQRVARAWAEWHASVARAEAVLALQALAASAEAVLTGQQAAAAVAASPVLAPLPYFPYPAAQGDSSKPSTETVAAAECAICLEALRPGQLCSEVPLCRHVFHSGCLELWARSNGSCPLCRARIVPGSDEVAIADDMV